MPPLYLSDPLWKPLSSYFHSIMASFGHVLLLFLAHLYIHLSTSSNRPNVTRLPIPLRCHPDQAKALLKLKKSFSFGKSSTMLSSWRDGTDCCFWEGVGCDASSGNVTVLDLNNRGVSSYGLDPAVFNLTSLQRLDLSMNYFGPRSIATLSHLPDNIPATGFERFTSLTHLNLSNSGFFGQLPISINKLVNLVSLDLSNSFDYVPYDASMISYSFDARNLLWVPSLSNLLANLSNLRELCLDGVDLSGSGEEWCISLASSVLHLQVLSLAQCDLSGPIHKSLARLRSLSVINLQGNNQITAGPFPEFFMDFLNLTVLQLSDTNLEGWFPSKSFQSKKLRILDLSANWDLSGHLPKLSNSSSLEILRLGMMNFSYVKSPSSNNFQALKELSLEGNVSVDFLFSFGRLGSLRQLDLSMDPSQINDLISILSWIGYQKNLLILVLDGFDFSGSGIATSSVSNFKNLRSLTMVDCEVPRSILSAVGNLKDLQTLEMNECATHGSVTSYFGNLTNLRNLRIEDCIFPGPLPPSIGNLRNLRNMYIDSSFSGPLPDAIGNLRNLRNMYIDSSFSGPMPAAFGNLTNLKTMEIFGDLFGTIPCAIGQLTKLARLVLEGCNLSGSIPSSVVNLTQLTILDLSYNHLYGEIPSSIFTLPALHELDLSMNQLSGPIRGFDKAPSQRESIYLGQNELSGSLPKEFYQLTNLKHLDVNSNNLRGLVDLSSFWRLSKLTSLHLSNNKLHVMDSAGNTGHLPTDLLGPNELRLAACSITQFPGSLARMNYMSYLDLSCNNITGVVPMQSWESWSSSLTYLNLSHNMLTSIGLSSDVLPFTTVLDVLDLSFNRLVGCVPMPKSSAIILDYSNNVFSSVLPNWISYLNYTNYLSMSKNSINGWISISICDPVLSALDLSYNNFHGQIPSCLIEKGQLGVLNLRKNHLEGMLPSNIATSCSLQTLDLHGNKIQGLLPRALSHCTDLEILDLGDNQIADTFPSWLMGFSNLRVLVLRSNQFYGTINDTYGDTKPEECFPRLQIMDLASNNFSGSLRPQWFERFKLMMSKLNNSGETLFDGNLTTPNQFYQDFTEISYKGSDKTFERILTTLTAIDLSNNRLEGAIPESVGRLVSLRVLNLSHNAFTGIIPVQLGRITDLESLDLSSNQLSGIIPQELTNLTFLGVLNLSNNHLVGKIPQARQFDTFGSSSFEGNAGLCGPPLSELPCGVSPHTPGVTNEHRSSHHVDVILFLFVGLGFGVGFAAAIVVKWGRIGRWFNATPRA